MNTLQLIQSKIKVPKGQYNSFGKYYYRSCEDIVDAAKLVLAEHGFSLILSDDLVMLGNRYYIKATATIKKDTEEYSATGFARESEEKKGMDDSQITGTASSYARKYALNGLFAIDDEKDADTDEHANKVKTAAPKTATPVIAGKIPPCPTCGGAMNDVRAGKRTPTQPDFKCKNPDCKNDKGYHSGAWLPKTSQQAPQSRYEEPADGLPTVKHDQWQATQNLAEASHAQPEDDGIDQITESPF